MNNENQSNRIKVILFLIIASGAGLAYRSYKGQLFATEKVLAPPSQTVSTEALFAQANELYKEKKYKEAITAYHKVIKQEPKHLQAHVSTGLAAARLGMMDHAQHHAQQTIEIDKNYLPGYILLGQCYQEKKEFENAKNSYLTALEIDQTSFEAHLFLSQLLIADGTSAGCAQAVMHAQRAAELKPTDELVQETLRAATSLAKTLLKKNKAEQKETIE